MIIVSSMHKNRGILFLLRMNCIDGGNSHEIFRNNTLISQLLKDYSGVSLFSDIKPEDIEDQTERFRLILGIEVEADTIKKVHIRIEEQEQDVFVIALIEHKSYIDYDIMMQLLTYMVMIWKDYAREQNSIKENASRTKEFRYPMIIPIVYYEGPVAWTADMHLYNRIAHAELAREFIPEFDYKIIPLKQYGNNELKKNNNEMSLIMMINKVQGKEDFHEFRKEMSEFFKSTYLNTSTAIQDIILEVTWGLLMKLKVPPEEAQQALDDVRGGKMGTLFANFQEFDITEVKDEFNKTKDELNKTKDELNKTKDDLNNIRQLLRQILAKENEEARDSLISKSDRDQLTELLNDN